MIHADTNQLFEIQRQNPAIVFLRLFNMAEETLANTVVSMPMPVATHTVVAALKKKAPVARKRSSSVDSGSIELLSKRGLTLSGKKKRVEPLLEPNPSRFVIFPIAHQKVWEMYKKSGRKFLDRRGT